jgi:hypothetical protein
MNTLGWSGVALLAGLAAAGGARYGWSEPAQGRLMRVAPAEPATQADLDAWRERLRADDLDLREQSFDALVAAAVADPSLREALQSWAKDESDAGVAWSARLALREVQSRLQRTPLGWSGAWSSPSDPFSNGPLFDDLQRRLEELHRQFGRTPNAGAMPPGSSTTTRSESYSLECGPDGVKCTVRRDENGQEVSEEYSAATVEELFQAHPELREKIGVTQSSPSDPFLRDFQLRFGRPGAAQLVAPRSNASVRTDVLGVVVQALSADESRALGLEPGVGLRVDRVEPGTIAQQLGLLRGHVLIEINQTPIRTRDDISNEIQRRGADGALDVIVIDRWGQKRTRTWKPDSERKV